MNQIVKFFVSLCFIFSLFGCSKEMELEEQVVGIYYTDEWHYIGYTSSATLHLNADGTCKHPVTWDNDKSCSWEIKDGNVIITKVKDSGEVQQQTAYIVENGIILADRFFEKK